LRQVGEKPDSVERPTGKFETGVEKARFRGPLGGKKQECHHAIQGKAQ